MGLSFLEYKLNWFVFSIFNILKYDNIVNQVHYLPFKPTNMVLLLLELMIVCRVSKYLICIADWEFKIYEVYLSILADSTSAFAEIMLAYDTLFWIAADCIFFLVSSDSIKSLMKIFYINKPQVLTLCST